MRFFSLFFGTLVLSICIASVPAVGLAHYCESRASIASCDAVNVDKGIVECFKYCDTKGFACVRNNFGNSCEATDPSVSMEQAIRSLVVNQESRDVRFILPVSEIDETQAHKNLKRQKVNVCRDTKSTVISGEDGGENENKIVEFLELEISKVSILRNSIDREFFAAPVCCELNLLYAPIEHAVLHADGTYQIELSKGADSKIGVEIPQRFKLVDLRILSDAAPNAEKRAHVATFDVTAFIIFPAGDAMSDSSAFAMIEVEVEGKLPSLRPEAASAASSAPQSAPPRSRGAAFSCCGRPATRGEGRPAKR